MPGIGVSYLDGFDESDIIDESSIRSLSATDDKKPTGLVDELQRELTKRGRSTDPVLGHEPSLKQQSLPATQTTTVPGEHSWDDDDVSVEEIE